MVYFSSILLAAALAAIDVGAQEASGVITETIQANTEFKPLEKADTSSPRDTLRSFLTNFNVAIDDWQQNTSISTAVGFRAFERVVSTMDFSTTPYQDSRSVLSRWSLMLLEVLGRIELQPFSEIPGDAEVARDGLSRWTIPGTSITIERIEKGPRAGEFLFSAWTVQRIPRFYHQVKHLPYKSHAIPGIYEAYLQRAGDAVLIDRQIRNLLKPVDTTSPRSTFDGFLDSMNRAYATAMETNTAFKANPRAMTIDEARQAEKKALNLMQRAVATLDLRKVPKAIRGDVGIESALKLKEVLDRMNLPLLDSIPDLEMAEAERKRLNQTRPVRWRYPDTPIEIVEITDGIHKGNFLFSANTVSQLDEIFDKVKDLPYRGDFSRLVPEYIHADRTEGFYDFYISTPGQLIPQTTFLGRWAEKMPDWMNAMYHGQTLWQWLSLVVTLAVTVIFFTAFHGVLLRRTKALSDASRNWRRVFFNLVVLAAILLLGDFLNGTVNLTGAELMVVRTCLTMAEWYFLATGAMFLCTAVAETVVASPKIDPEGIQASYIRAVFGILGLISMAVLLINGLFHVGVSLGPLLASVGIGGLAIALAARPTLENIIGSFMIFLDKPYRVGQRVNVLGQNGTVESIGLRSTKIRLLTGHLTSIPNQQMANAEVENIGRRPYIRRVMNVTITYDTPPEMINRAVEILREILSVPEAQEADDLKNIGGTEEFALTNVEAGEAGQQAHPNEAINQPDFEPRVYFNELNADSLNIIVIYWYHPPEYWDYLEHANWINLQIMERFNAEGIDFAFPTQTLHMAGDDKRPLTVGQHWVSQEEGFSPSAILAQAAALGVQAARTPASDAVRPEGREPEEPKPRVEGEMTEAPVEDEVLHGSGESEAGDDAEVQR